MPRKCNSGGSRRGALASSPPPRPHKPCGRGVLPLQDLAPVITPCRAPQDSVLSGRQDGSSRAPSRPASLLPESLRLLNGVEKLLLQLLVTLVGRQIQAVEAERGKGWLAGAALLPFWGGGCLAGPATLTHHVWLRGSQVSLPTLSMQNFCGPLLPDGEEQWRKCTGHIWRTGCLTSHRGPASPLPSMGGRLTNELCESSDRQAAGPCHKLEEPDSLLVVHLLDHLQPPDGRGNGRSIDRSWDHLPTHPPHRLWALPKDPRAAEPCWPLRLPTCQNHWICLLFLV